jgi:Cu/Ag efflux pump CusA
LWCPVTGRILKSGIGYQVQIEIPQPALKSVADLGAIPVLKKEGGAVLLRDVADLSSGKMPGELIVTT